MIALKKSVYNTPTYVRFSDIKQGNIFLDCTGDLGIKVSHTQWYSFTHDKFMRKPNGNLLIDVKADITISY